MLGFAEDSFIGEQIRNHDVAELEDCTVAVEASYYLHLFLNKTPTIESLLPALGGLTGIQSHIEKDLDKWEAFKITPFFVFDGQSVTGQDEVSALHGMSLHVKTEEAWSLYFDSQAQEAVAAFGAISRVWRPQVLYPLFKRILRARGLRCMTAPYNAAAQLAHFDISESDQFSAIMGSQELLLYPIHDAIIVGFDWMGKAVTTISKKQILRMLNISESVFVDAHMMGGTTFLRPFPPLEDKRMYARPGTIMEAINLLRTSGKFVDAASAAFHDIVRDHDPAWLDKYKKARMAIQHFVYITENGEVAVNDYDNLTADNYEYLGYQLPAELFHYLSTGLIGARVLSYITHGQILQQPTVDGVVTPEYRHLVTEQLVPVRETTVCLVVARLHRAFHHKDVVMKTWFDPKFSHPIKLRSVQPPPGLAAATWRTTQESIDSNRSRTQRSSMTPIASQVVALLDSSLVKSTISDTKHVRGLDTPDVIVSVTIWRFLHLRGYILDDHNLSRWGLALATSLISLQESGLETPEIAEAAMMAFELIRFGLLNGKNMHEELKGQPVNGSDEDKASIMLISRCSTLLSLRQRTIGYTGPLNKNLLVFRSLSTTLREADRDMIEAILASMFLYNQSERDRDDYADLYLGLPFLFSPDIAMGIAIKTYLDEYNPNNSSEGRKERGEMFVSRFFPHSTHFVEDIDLCCTFFAAIVKGISQMDQDMAVSDKEAWGRALSFLECRR